MYPHQGRPPQAYTLHPPQLHCYLFTHHPCFSAVAAVHDGYVLQKATTRSPLGGALLTAAMLKAAESKGTPILPRCAVRRTETTPGHWEVRPGLYTLHPSLHTLQSLQQ